MAFLLVPVFFLGIITETIIRSEQNLPIAFLGLGKVIKSTRVSKFLDSIISKIEI